MYVCIYPFLNAHVCIFICECSFVCIRFLMLKGIYSFSKACI